MHLAVAAQPDETADELRKLPARFPARRPKRYARCLALGLGITVPCPFARCRHNLLFDELRGETLPDADLWRRETCSLAVAARGQHKAATIGGFVGGSETFAEEALRCALVGVMRALGCDELVRLNKNGAPRLRRPMRKGYKLDSKGMDGLADLVEARWKRGLPRLKVPPVRRLSRAEAEVAYPGKLHPAYGEPRQTTQAGSLPPGGTAKPGPGRFSTRRETPGVDVSDGEAKCSDDCP
ncbi:MAG: hypothetical protein JXP73_03245 [Deltaproteobacteria bacterium]|nr:hypothetical protein [Deltaproteobacteria bacterium]